MLVDERDATIKNLVKAIANIHADRGYPPSVREITEVLGFASTSTTHKYMKIASRRGLLNVDPKVSRSVLLTTNGRQLARRK